MTRPRWTGRIAAALAVTGLSAATFVAGQQTVRAADAATRATQAPAATQLWTAKEESVGRTLRLPASVEAVSSPGPLVHLGGVVTDVAVGTGADVAPGGVLFEVGGRPVHAGVGRVPAHRALEPGDEGDDVRQLRGFLCALQALTACADSASFDEDVAAAVRSWHRRQGRTGDTVELGEIMWFAALPTRLAPTADLAVGAALAAGARPIDVETGAVLLTVVVSRDQAALVPAGTRVTIGDLTGVTGEPTPAAGKPDAFELPLESAAGQPLCAEPTPCLALLGAARQRSVEANLEVVPARTGIGVPTLAIQTAADGSTAVVSETGESLPVSVIQSAGGLSLVEGLPAGTRLRLSGGPRA